MNDKEAGHAAIDGARLRRPLYVDAAWHFYKDGGFWMHYSNGTEERFPLLLADDWEVIPEPEPEPGPMYQRCKVQWSPSYDSWGFFTGGNSGRWRSLSRAPDLAGFGGYGFDLPDGSDLISYADAWRWVNGVDVFWTLCHRTPGEAEAAGWQRKHADCVWVKRASA